MPLASGMVLGTGDSTVCAFDISRIRKGSEAEGEGARQAGRDGEGRREEGGYCRVAGSRSPLWSMKRFGILF